jgi:hypothetical protein
MVSFNICIINLGDIGSQFYIIISGNVSLKVPTVLENDAISPDDLFFFMMENESDIDWEEFKSIVSS